MRFGLAAILGVSGICAISAACQALEFTYAGTSPNDGSGRSEPLPTPGADSLGWTGPGKYFDEGPERSPCPVGYVTALDGNTQPATPTCTACSCSDYDDSECSDVTVGLYENDACDGVATASLTDRLCHPRGFAVGARRVSCKPLECKPSTTTFAISWTRAQRLCRPETAAAAASADPTSGHGECVWQAGDLPCPSDDGARYKERYLTFEGFDGSCRECRCLPGACGDVELKIGQDVGCSPIVGYVGVHCDECAPVSNRYVQVVGVSPSRGCTPAGGDLVGELKPKGPTTVCCTD